MVKIRPAESPPEGYNMLQLLVAHLKARTSLARNLAFSTKLQTSNFKSEKENP
jgi:hypothetical protein